jgi:hypothetical protein
MALIDRIQRGRTSMPPRIVPYGINGVGKSTFASQSPKPIFLPTEDGLSEIECERFPLAKSLDDVLTALAELHVTPHQYQTVVIDSLDWTEQLIFDELCRQYSVASIEKVDGGYARGYTLALTHWRKILEALDRLRNDRGMAVICIAHSKIEKFEDPESQAYDRYVLRLHKHAAALVCEWADAVLFATRKFRVQNEAAGFNRKRGIANAIGKDGGDRILRCIGGPSCVAKNRYRLPEDLPLSWAAFMAAFTNH